MRCGNTDAQLALAKDARWDKDTFGWSLSSGARSFAPLSAELIADALGEWSKVCGVTFFETDDDSQCDLIFLVGRGRRAGVEGDTLAWCEVGPATDQSGRRRPSQMMIDTAEDWESISLPATVVHESGHFLCFMHEPKGSDSIMAPSLSRITTPRPVDIEFAQKLYGKPKSISVPIPGKPPTLAKMEAVIRTPEGAIWKGLLDQVK